MTSRTQFRLASLPLALACAHAVSAQQLIGYVNSRDAVVTGASDDLDGRAVLTGSASVTAKDHTAPITLGRGGIVRVCQTSVLHLTESKGFTTAAPLLLSLDRGAIEIQMTATPTDSLMTPDLRLTVRSQGPLDLRMRVARNGDTCVENRGFSAPTLAVSDPFGESMYELQPNQHVLFEHGSVHDVVDHETTPCGCPDEKGMSIADALLAPPAAIASVKPAASAPAAPLTTAPPAPVAPVAVTPPTPTPSALAIPPPAAPIAKSTPPAAPIPSVATVQSAPVTPPPSTAVTKSTPLPAVVPPPPTPAAPTVASSTPPAAIAAATPPAPAVTSTPAPAAVIAPTAKPTPAAAPAPASIPADTLTYTAAPTAAPTPPTHTAEPAPPPAPEQPTEQEIAEAAAEAAARAAALHPFPAAISEGLAPVPQPLAPPVSAPQMQIADTLTYVAPATIAAGAPLPVPSSVTAGQPTVSPAPTPADKPNDLVHIIGHFFKKLFGH